ncbi:hypothetical protein A7M79_00075 [Acinetobacter baumannii]|uniref:hypothetical protein n=1 Tax=Acinetobacter baumannii TaxID=470 RepID=UPI0008DDF759|nr:hypothetical protein [Acinetobacter baumannii]OIH11919.1 hypothetical protein A7M79_00075 [Acinetobacter baumannii]
MKNEVSLDSLKKITPFFHDVSMSQEIREVSTKQSFLLDGITGNINQALSNNLDLKSVREFEKKLSPSVEIVHKLYESIAIKQNEKAISEMSNEKKFAISFDNASPSPN